MGILGGLFPALLFKKLKERGYHMPPVCEICITLIAGQYTYMMCEHWHLSGILGILISGIVMSHYSYYNMNTES